MNEYPRAILHFDGDAFFASVEQQLDYRLKGRPVVTGGERGCVTSLSYEAKAHGVMRSMPMREVKRICPEVVIVPGNYTAYSLFARRMYEIVRTYTPYVEEYSIDECFADITGLEKRFGMSYADIARMIKARLEEELGLTFGVGLAGTKTLAKVASKHHKPAGFTEIPHSAIDAFLRNLSAGSVWGLGGRSSLKLLGLGVTTAREFVQKDDAWLLAHGFGKPYREIRLELLGTSVKPLVTESDGRIGSIMKTHTFRPTRNREAIYAEFSKNVEAACVKARRHGVKARALSFFLKSQEFMYYGRQLVLPVPLHDPRDMLRAVEDLFDEVYDADTLYRASGITLRSLVRDEGRTFDLFGEEAGHDARRKDLLSALDRVNGRYGKHTLVLASSMQAIPQVRTRPGPRLPKGFKGKSLSIPYLGTVR